MCVWVEGSFLWDSGDSNSDNNYLCCYYHIIDIFLFWLSLVVAYNITLSMIFIVILGVYTQICVRLHICGRACIDL